MLDCPAVLIVLIARHVQPQLLTCKRLSTCIGLDFYTSILIKMVDLYKYYESFFKIKIEFFKIKSLLLIKITIINKKLCN